MSFTHSATSAPSFEFGRCQVVVPRRELLYQGQPVSLGGRAFDILVTLLEARGTVVAKDDLIERAWPGRIVEENTLEAQVSALRRALGEDRAAIRTVAGRGYQFVGELLSGAAPIAAKGPVRLPVNLTPLVGREDALREILELSQTNRLITLVGAGGVGKTRLALEAARRLAPRFPDSVSVAELGPLRSPEFVPAAVAAALGFPQSAGTPSLDRIASAISTQRMLLVLDNCEHLIEIAAQIVEQVLHAGIFVSIIATSRESLKAEGEYVYRVASLDVPSEGNQDAADIARHGALQLFDARIASAAGPGVLPDDAETTALKARICRQLDGIPLAIELAAARVRVFGVRGVAQRIEDRFNLLTGGARTALPRQRTLRATLDWSYDLLSHEERQVLGRLSIFAGPFSIESASAVASSPDIAEPAVVELLANLVEKSLISADAGAAVQYRLLETTRLYAREKMKERGDLDGFARRHALYYCELMTKAEREWDVRTTADWLALYAPHMENLRAAVNWCFSPGGDQALGVALTTAGLSLWLQLALLEECLPRVEVALAYLDAESIVEGRSRMKLYAARGASRLYQGVGLKTGTAFRQALDFAERQGEVEYEMRATWGLWGVRYLNGEYEKSLALAHRFGDLAKRNPHREDRLIGDRMAGMSLLCMGRLSEARGALEQMVSSYRRPVRRSHVARFIYEQKVVALSSLAHVLWLQGLASQATVAARRAIEEARALDHPPSICYALTESVCPIALLVGGPEALENPAAAAVEATRRHGLSTWKARGRMWQGLFLLSRGDVEAYERDIRPAFDEIGNALFVLHYTGFVSATCEQLGRHGLVEQALHLIERSIERARRVSDTCSLPELLRVRGELLADEPGARKKATAELVEAVETSRNQESLAWKLRCATSLARAWARMDQPEAAVDLLAPLYAQFNDGIETFDLKAAESVLKLQP